MNSTANINPGPGVAKVIGDEVKGHRDSVCALTWAQLTQRAGMRRMRNVKRYVRELQAQGLISITENDGGGPNIIRITSAEWLKALNSA